MEAFIADSQMVGHLVKDGFADLYGELGGTAGESQVFLTKDADSVGRCRVIAHSTVLQHHPFVEAQQPMAVFGLGGSWSILDHYVEVVDALDDPFGQFSKHVIDDTFERGEVSPQSELAVIRS